MEMVSTLSKACRPRARIAHLDILHTETRQVVRHAPQGRIDQHLPPDLANLAPLANTPPPPRPLRQHALYAPMDSLPLPTQPSVFRVNREPIA